MFVAQLSNGVSNGVLLATLYYFYLSLVHIVAGRLIVTNRVGLGLVGLGFRSDH